MGNHGSARRSAATGGKSEEQSKVAPTFSSGSGEGYSAHVDALIVLGYAEAGLPAGLDERFDGQLSGLLAGARFTFKRGSIFAIPSFGKVAAKWVIVAGLGDAMAPAGEAVRRACGLAAREARKLGAGAAAVLLPAGSSADDTQATVEGIALGLYEFTRYKSGETGPSLRDVALYGGAGTDAIARGEATAAGVNLARDLVNTISEDKTPPQIAEWAERVAREAGLSCKVLDLQQLQAGGYNSIVAVGRGSAAEPRLVELTYTPEGGAGKTVALVGKTITFDSGGLDLKTAEGMYTMKGDMGGGAAVLGAMQAIAALKPDVRVIGLLAAAENMPSGTAIRPSDVITALNGKTYEIGSTDAEGRMVLADAVTHAARAGADEIIDLATLTGSKVVALGDIAVAAIANDRALADRVVRAGEEAGEKIWPLPVWDEYKEQLRSDIADLKSTGGRKAGTITAGLFIGEFVEGKPWVHLDIAGSAFTEELGPYTPKGGTGVMVRTLLRFIMSQEG